MNRESRYPLRLPEPLKERTQHEAAKTGLSMNEIIITALNDYFGGRDEMERRLTELEKNLSQIQSCTPTP